MRVVVAALSAPAHLNGVSRHAANLVRSLLHSHEISMLHLLVGAWQRPALVDAIATEDPRLRIHSVDIGAGTLSRNWWYYAKLPSIVGELDPAIVHLTFPVPVAREALNSFIVVSLHDLYPFDIPENFGFPKGLANRAVVRQCVGSADAIACVSESTRQGLQHRLGRSVARKATVIPNAVESVTSLCMPRQLESRFPFVLCVAQHRRNKNIGVALRVFERIVKSRIMPADSQLVIVGGRGPETVEIERQIRQLRLDRNTLLLSGVSDAELQWCYRNCAVLLAPSSIEGFGLPIAEGLLAGCKIVCSDIRPFRELGGSRCRYVALGEGEIGRFVRAIQEALAAGPSRPADMPWLSPEEIGKKYIILYRHLLATCPRRRSVPTGNGYVSRSGSV